MQHTITPHATYRPSAYNVILLVTRRLATTSSPALSESAVPQFFPSNPRARSNARHGPVSPDNDNPTALGGPLPLGTFDQRRQTYADRRPPVLLPPSTFDQRQQVYYTDLRPHMDDVVARYSRGSRDESRRRYREESGKLASAHAGATRTTQKGTTGGGGAAWNYPRISRTGLIAN